MRSLRRVRSLRRLLSSDASSAQRAADQLSRVLAEQAALADQVRDLQGGLHYHHAVITSVLRTIADEEPENRRRLVALRESDDYLRVFDEETPLVTIPIPTYDNHSGLRTRSLPSVLAQTYSNLEVIVVGDAAPAEAEAVVREIDDERIRFVNLDRRGPYPDDPDRRWHVAGTMPLNEGIRLARGDWIAVLNDDDAFRPQHIERLLALARGARAEVAYGRLVMRNPDCSSEELGVFPPALHQFGWQASLMHAGLRFFEWHLSAERFGLPGDWHRCERMLRAGVRFAMTEAVVADYFPSRRWREAAGKPG